MFIKRLYDRIRYRRMFVIADCSDNSVTLSKNLYNHMDKSCDGELKDVFTFSLQDEKCRKTYCFVTNPVAKGLLEDGESAPVSPVQYNAQFKSIGFVADCPTVNQIAYDYCLPIDKPCRLMVKPVTMGELKYYQICR